jgi:hypothetical protein
MPAVADIVKNKKDALKTKRKLLYDEYTRRPTELHLALEIRKIDDEIAAQTNREKKPSSAPSPRPDA